LGGAAINAVFMDHFQDVAWAHFLVRSLERKYSPAAVRAQWDQLTSEPHAFPPQP
jgi:hypothetical protein